MIFTLRISIPSLSGNRVVEGTFKNDMGFWSRLQGGTSNADGPGTRRTRFVKYCLRKLKTG
jgi:hypothetical protein